MATAFGKMFAEKMLKCYKHMDQEDDEHLEDQGSVAGTIFWSRNWSIGPNLELHDDIFCFNNIKDALNAKGFHNSNFKISHKF